MIVLRSAEDRSWSGLAHCKGQRPAVACTEVPNCKAIGFMAFSRCTAHCWYTLGFQGHQTRACIARRCEFEKAASATDNGSCSSLQSCPAVVLQQLSGCRRRLTQAVNSQHGVTHEAEL